ncbi:MAG: hypothetical protein RBU23_11785 [Candidatus Auribacterota bacterium]|nr:hypothetical protein [Candidatus Auribacterota bacterium]
MPKVKKLEENEVFDRLYEIWQWCNEKEGREMTFHFNPFENVYIAKLSLNNGENIRTGIGDTGAAAIKVIYKRYKELSAVQV